MRAKGDIHNTELRLTKATIQLEKSAIDPEDKDLIVRFVELKAAERVKSLRQEKYLITLRLLAERYLPENKCFMALSKEDAIRIVTQIERSDLSDWTKHDYELLFKLFMIWLGKAETVDWIRTPNPKSLPRETFSDAEVNAMINAALSLRDRALIASLYEGAFRIGELGMMKMKDLRFDRFGAVALVTGKTGPRPVRLIWSVPYIAQWLEIHPSHADKEAYIWISQRGKLMSYDAIRAQLIKIARRAGIQKKVNPHNFRHSRATFLARQLTESQMDAYLGWVQGSRMPSIYVHMSGRDLDADLLRMYGINPEEVEEEDVLAMQRCPHCGTVNTEGARVCNTCRKPLRPEEVMKRDNEMKEMFEDFMELVAEKPEWLEKFQNKRK